MSEEDLFTIDATPVATWTCDVCNVTISIRDGDSHAIETHQKGKPHQKKLRKAAVLAGEIEDPTKRVKRSSEETDTSVLGDKLKCRDASTNAKSVLNEVVQRKGWQVSFVHQSARRSSLLLYDMQARH